MRENENEKRDGRNSRTGDGFREILLRARSGESFQEATMKQLAHRTRRCEHLNIGRLDRIAGVNVSLEGAKDDIW